MLLGESTEVTLPPSSAPLGLVLCNHESRDDGAGVRIMSLSPDGRGSMAGLTAGDTLLAVDGILCTEHAQAVQMLNEGAPHVAARDDR